MDISKIRDMFPALGETVYGRPLVYLDNAATSQRSLSVIDKWTDMSLHHNSNIHRAVHKIAQDATQEYEDTRDAVRDFIGAGDRREIVFTSGATAGLNMLAYCLGEAFLHDGDEIVIAESEHHSDIVPWQITASRHGAVIRVLHVDERGYLEMDALEEMMEGGLVKILCVAHVSNVLGLVNPVRQITEICRKYKCISVIDGAQGVVHCDVDVRSLGCDFYVFSGHKIYGVPGTGVVYGRMSLLESMPPYMSGGEMIDTVRWSGTTYAPVPQKFEAGTQNLSGTPALKAAIDTAKYLKTKEIEDNLHNITAYMLDALRSDSRIRLYGDPLDIGDKVPLFSFSVHGAHHEDLALILDKMGVAVRSGQMCAEPLMDRYGVTGMLRASFAPYNTMQEAEYFVRSLHRAVDMLT